MLELEGGQAAEGLLPMFDPDVPTYSRVVAVLAGRNPGTILVDDAATPTWCVARETGWGHTFVGGRPGPSELSDAVARLRRDGDVDLVSWDAASPDVARLPSPDDEFALLELSQRPPGDALDAILREVPAGLDFRRMDRELIQRCEWGYQIERGCGSVDRFLRNGLGFCLTSGREILCEVYALYWGVDTVEIGVVTNEKHRGKGYATLTCAHLARACEERGHGTTWTCYVDNRASAAVARNLGYGREREFRLLRYKRSSTGK